MRIDYIEGTNVVDRPFQTGPAYYYPQRKSTSEHIAVKLMLTVNWDEWQRLLEVFQTQFGCSAPDPFARSRALPEEPALAPLLTDGVIDGVLEDE